MGDCTHSMTFVHTFLFAAYNHRITHKDKAHRNTTEVSISLALHELLKWRKMHIELGMQFYNYIISLLFLFLMLNALLDNQSSISRRYLIPNSFYVVFSSNATFSLWSKQTFQALSKLKNICRNNVTSSVDRWTC